MTDDTYYSVLGIPETATEAEIKVAYRNLLKKIHPDTVSTLSPELREISEGVTREIIKAYATLSDPHKRREYDRQLAESRRPLSVYNIQPAKPRYRSHTRSSTRSSRRGRRSRRRAPQPHSPKHWVLRHTFAVVLVLGLMFLLVILFVYLTFSFAPDSKTSRFVPAKAEVTCVIAMRPKAV